MSEIVDDLLSEVEELEQATQELETTAEKAKNKTHELDKAKTVAASETQLIALETAKTAQEAAVLSQKAAESAIKQSDALKAEVLELNESNFNWRQSVRNASKEFQAVKSSFKVMLVTSVIFSLLAAATIGYLYYSMNKKLADYQGQTMDLIATENALFKKSLTLKIDELASVVENLSVSAYTLPTPMPTKAISNPEDSNLIPDLSKEHKGAQEKSNISENTMSETNSQAMETEKTAEIAVEDKTESPKPMASSQQIDDILEPINWLKQNSATNHELEQIKSLIADLQIQLKEVNKRIKASPAGSGLNEQELKKLNDMSWLVRKQGKTIERLEKSITSLSKNSMSKNYSSQLKAIQAEQTNIRLKLKDIDKSLGELTELSKEPPPYSYRAK